MKTRYAVQRARKDGSLYGPVHGSDDSNITKCGQIIDEGFFIVDNKSEGIITCKKCLKAGE